MSTDQIGRAVNAAQRARDKKRREESMPYVENYPPLNEWLRKHNARSDGQFFFGDRRNPKAILEKWIAGKGTFFTLTHADKRGWDIFTSEGANSIPIALADAEKRLGIT